MAAGPALGRRKLTQARNTSAAANVSAFLSPSAPPLRPTVIDAVLLQPGTQALAAIERSAYAAASAAADAAAAVAAAALSAEGAGTARDSSDKRPPATTTLALGQAPASQPAGSADEPHMVWLPPYPAPAAGAAPAAALMATHATVQYALAALMLEEPERLEAAGTSALQLEAAAVLLLRHEGAMRVYTSQEECAARAA